ncbi:MAG: hypothetical protein C5B52_17015 [Bacteroidetes bacterium]|nr:MAG: hypothetical protein C5B52_17015 [Bacteroidota bacterium]
MKINPKSLIWVLFSTWIICSSQKEIPTNDPIIVQNYYYPKDGNEAKVLELRKQASALRHRLSLPRGRILKRVGGDGGSYIIWECEYASQASRDHDLEVLGNSEEFKSIQSRMDTLIIRFERSVFTIEDK